MFYRVFSTAWCYTVAVWTSFGSGCSSTVTGRCQSVTNILSITGYKLIVVPNYVFH